MGPFNTLLVEQTESLAVVTVNRPDKLNALNSEVLRELVSVFEALGEAEVRAAILTGAGRAFVAGADIAAMANQSVTEARAFSALGHRVGAAIEASAFPVIAAVNGFALGGGTELALSCDFIYASTKAKFGQPEVKLGLMPGFGGTTRLSRRVGLARATELVLTGETLDAAEALRIGLVNRVLEPEALLGAAMATARLIAANAPLAVGAAKRSLGTGHDTALGTANAYEIAAFAGLFGTEDAREGMSAFVEKRGASFRGR